MNECLGERGERLMKKFFEDNKLRMHLQMFAEDGGQEGGQGVGGQDNANDGQPEMFDRSEVDRQISKAVESALQKQRQKFEQEKQAEIERAKKEAEEYSKLSEREKLEKQLEEREKQLEQREREIRLKTLKSDVESDLKENGLPTDFADVLILLEEPEEIKQKVNGIKKTFDQAVNDQVKVALRQDAPEDGTGIRKTQNGASGSIADFARQNRIIKD